LGGPRDVAGPGWKSLRLLVKSDGMGFPLTETFVDPQQKLALQYLNHIEACFCLAGRAILREVETGREHVIEPGVLYAPDVHDAHEVEVTSAEPLHLICVFSPALEGTEVHGPDGSYAAS
jgi:L-ectoine synthase